MGKPLYHLGQEVYRRMSGGQYDEVVVIDPYRGTEGSKQQYLVEHEDGSCGTCSEIELSVERDNAAVDALESESAYDGRD